MVTCPASICAAPCRSTALPRSMPSAVMTPPAAALLPPLLLLPPLHAAAAAAAGEPHDAALFAAGLPSGVWPATLKRDRAASGLSPI